MKLPVIDGTAWINRGNQPEKVTAKATCIPKSKQATIGGKGIRMTAPGIAAVMQAPRQFKATDLHRANARKVKPVVRAPRKRATAEGSVRVWRAAGAIPTAKKAKPVNAPKPCDCEACGLPFPSRNALGKHFNDAHVVQRESGVGA